MDQLSTQPVFIEYVTFSGQDTIWVYTGQKKVWCIVFEYLAYSLLTVVLRLGAGLAFPRLEIPQTGLCQPGTPDLWPGTPGLPAWRKEIQEGPHRIYRKSPHSGQRARATPGRSSQGLMQPGKPWHSKEFQIQMLLTLASSGNLAGPRVSLG